MKITNQNASPAFQAKLKNNRYVNTMVDKMNLDERAKFKNLLTKLDTFEKDTLIEFNVKDVEPYVVPCSGIIVKCKDFKLDNKKNGQEYVFYNGRRTFQNEFSPFDVKVDLNPISNIKDELNPIERFKCPVNKFLRALDNLCNEDTYIHKTFFKTKVGNDDINSMLE